MIYKRSNGQVSDYPEPHHSCLSELVNKWREYREFCIDYYKRNPEEDPYRERGELESNNLGYFMDWLAEKQ